MRIAVRNLVIKIRNRIAILQQNHRVRFSVALNFLRGYVAISGYVHHERFMFIFSHFEELIALMHVCINTARKILTIIWSVKRDTFENANGIVSMLNESMHRGAARKE